MRVFSFCTVIAVLLVASSPAWAQGCIELNGAYTLPVKDFNNLADPGGGGSLELFFPGSSNFQIGAHIGYNWFAHDTNFTGGNTRILELVPSYRISLLPTDYGANIFIQAGYGWYKWNMKNKQHNVTINKFNKTDAGYYGAVGLVGRLSEHILLTVMPQYHVIRVDNPVIDNIRYWSFNIGLQFEPGRHQQQKGGYY